MANTSFMTRNENHDDASSSNMIKTCDNSNAAPWSDLNHDALFIVMMQLGVVDFLAFSRVCKSWRSVSLSNKKRFMASKPPMLMRISTRGNEKEYCLEDFGGRKFKSIIPHSKRRIYVGLICGYLILYGWATRDFWLVNPITGHELHFPRVPAYIYSGESRVSAILVFSSSTSKCVFFISKRCTCQIWFSLAREGTWNHVSSISNIFDIHAFKGKIYTLHSIDHYSWEVGHLCEMRLNPEPKLTLLEAKDFLKQHFLKPKFVSLGENLTLMETYFRDSYNVHEVDLGKMKWVPFEETRDEYEFFNIDTGPIPAIIRESLVDPQS
ncbi:uncharacterized protein LOC111876598 [Lactuca sativa]|uniref:uncharacterized protein LOC111876598 n=1 Tax=Lactuca sativa TaxID=4236 RepID=UPI000CCA8684|nr:uncharacterized protein LOC111876598 [Lactuca sativa]